MARYVLIYLGAGREQVHQSTCSLVFRRRHSNDYDPIIYRHARQYASSKCLTLIVCHGQTRRNLNAELAEAENNNNSNAFASCVYKHAEKQFTYIVVVSHLQTTRWLYLLYCLGSVFLWDRHCRVYAPLRLFLSFKPLWKKTLVSLRVIPILFRLMFAAKSLAKCIVHVNHHHHHH